MCRASHPASHLARPASAVPSSKPAAFQTLRPCCCLRTHPTQALDLWLGFVAEAEAAAERAPAAPAAAARRAARDAAVRSLLLKDPDTAMAERLFGRDPFQTLLKVAGHHPDVRLQLAADVQAREA